MTCGRQGGQGRMDDITGKGLRTAVALSTASCSQNCRRRNSMHSPPLTHSAVEPMLHCSAVSTCHSLWSVRIELPRGQSSTHSRTEYTHRTVLLLIKLSEWQTCPRVAANGYEIGNSKVVWRGVTGSCTHSF